MTTITAPTGLSRAELARRVAGDLVDGWCVNVGIGAPLQLPAQATPGKEILYHCEHGLLGVGPAPDGEPDPDVTDAGKNPVTLLDGAASFDSSTSFAIARGGRLDLCVLGGLQVSERGDLANWLVPGGNPGVGGAMDLAAGARRVWVMMDHLDKRGNPKLRKECTFPLTGAGVVDRVYTNLAVFEFVDGVLTLRECAPGITPEQLGPLTEATFQIDLWNQGESE
ncbi:3-oxoacid CoA-transferase subunit B [Amycolatopsis pithecellobii]|uniref:3-oxoacid CoA-transferase subunit B n=1 Tax=Amycolatopsis pithecellobii TaxID=664692 RepID=A0A6N7YZR3_9PSEU|nr:3-oxoacid CoA-transferase subunit B [Amycolatopsis pithecellobii]MTD52971.1 3-oxoacid CoA-transferase subunit B [Amycolatopsis pithecellobii]